MKDKQKKWSDSQLIGRSYERKDQPFWGTYPKFNTVEKKSLWKHKPFLDIMLKFKSPTWFSEVYRTGLSWVTISQSHFSE